MQMLQGQLRDRSQWSAIGHCPIEKTMALAGTKSAMLIMREAYYGTTRFEDFVERVGITKAAAATRLAELVAIGLLAKRPYREPGQRERSEYVLTDSGIEFMPVVWALFEWGRKHLGELDMGLVHLGCGAPARVQVTCEKGHPVPSEELGMVYRQEESTGGQDAD